MSYIRKRKCTRSLTWPETEAKVTFTEVVGAKKTKQRSVVGRVTNLGASGMRLKTMEPIPRNARVSIEIRFDPPSPSPDLKLGASGRVVRLCKDGVGIQFTGIDLKRLQACIVKKINLSAKNHHNLAHIPEDLEAQRLTD
jgi:hypothetical protein